MHKGKKYVDSAKTIDRTKQYDPAEALSTVVSTAKAKFDETIELHVKLGVDSRHAPSGPLHQRCLRLQPEPRQPLRP